MGPGQTLEEMRSDFVGDPDTALHSGKGTQDSSGLTQTPFDDPQTFYGV